ncbi:response regulator [Fulvivirga sediminis]|uniref:Response regulator n=1 Tax=Fulvivirga sediminis TaxID=2803949 RepID=A0A937JYS7_9BACT|nr:response regulator [Fulvivirga sediminis]MBL3654565.1 response regulator [Fulvivirga sediminis]
MSDEILLIEDNEDDITLTLRALKKQNILNHVVIARDGTEALDLLLGNKNHEAIKPALILLDLKLPKLDGMDVLREINKVEIDRPPIVILTTSTEEEDIIKSYNLGANSYIRKPVDFSKFTEVVGQLGLYWLVINEKRPKNE